MNKVAQHVKDYWPLWGIVVAVATALTTYLGLPKRVEKVEAGQATLEDSLSQYLQAQKEALAEQRGYQKALNEKVMQQQAPNEAAPPLASRTGLREWDDADQTFWCCDVSSEEWRQWCFDFQQWRRCQ